MTYTLNSLPPAIDEIIRARAASEQISPEEAIVEALVDYLGVMPTSVVQQAPPDTSAARRRSPEVDMALREQGLIDWEAWSDGIKRRDLSGVAGLHLITPEMKAIFVEQRRVDPELWT